MPDDCEPKRLFLAALELPPAQRAAFLAERCADAPELQARVAALLAAEALAGAFLLGAPAPPPASASPVDGASAS